MFSAYTPPRARCPACQTRLDAASTKHSGGPPREGDITVCAYCALACQFEADLTLRPLSADVLEALPEPTRQEVMRIRAALLARPFRPRKDQH